MQCCPGSAFGRLRPCLARPAQLRGEPSRRPLVGLCPLERTRSRPNSKDEAWRSDGPISARRSFLACLMRQVPLFLRAAGHTELGALPAWLGQGVLGRRWETCSNRRMEEYWAFRWRDVG